MTPSSKRQQQPANCGSPAGEPPAADVEVEFDWLADADSRLGPMLEAIVNGRYYWVPVHRIARIEIEAPADLRDLVWLPAQFLWKNQGDAVGMIPTRYAGSEASSDPQVQLARRTEWTETAPGVFHGLGQRLLATSEGEHAIMDVRGIFCGQ
jgi:type VI secretion system protein ImpE